MKTKDWYSKGLQTCEAFDIALVWIFFILGQ